MLRALNGGGLLLLRLIRNVNYPSYDQCFERVIGDVVLEPDFRESVETHQFNLACACWNVAKSHAQNMNQEYIQHVSSVFLGLFPISLLLNCFYLAGVLEAP